MTRLPEIILNNILAATVTLLLAACASSPANIVEQLDPVTGVTVSFARAPVTMYRDNPSQAAYARDFLYLGPIVVNRSGEKRQYLWVGIWGTMQQVQPTRFRDGFETVVIVANGEPLMLELTGWTPDTIGLSKPVYVKPVASTADAYYEVTPDQLLMIANAKEIRLHSTGNSPGSYELWRDRLESQQSLSSFAPLVTQ